MIKFANNWSKTVKTAIRSSGIWQKYSITFKSRTNNSRRGFAKERKPYPKCPFNFNNWLLTTTRPSDSWKIYRESLETAVARNSLRWQAWGQLPIHLRLLGWARLVTASKWLVWDKHSVVSKMEILIYRNLQILKIRIKILLPEIVLPIDPQKNRLL